MDCRVRKKIVRTIILIIVWITLFYQKNTMTGTQQEAFLRAENLYNEGNFTKALELYQSIAHKSTAVFYNMGNCHYASNNFASAVVNWRRAQKECSITEFNVLEAFIEKAYNAAGQSYNMTFISRAGRSLKHVMALIPILVWQLLWLLCWSLLICYAGTLLRTSRYLLFCMILFSFIFATAKNITHYRDQRYPKAIVTKNFISVYAGPGMDYAKIAQAKLLDCVRVYKVHAGWFYVHIPQLGYGWLQEKDSEII